MLRFKRGGDGTLTIRDGGSDGGSTCGRMNIEQSLLHGASASQLRVDIRNAKRPPKLLLSRADAFTDLNGTLDAAGGDVWGFTQELKTGRWQIEYGSGSEVCARTPLMEVNCSAGYEQAGDGCAAAKEVHRTNLMLTMGLGIGAVLALCVIMLLVLIRKHPSRAKKIFLSFMRGEVKLALKIFMEAW
jgi:hypothetical protein